MDVLDVFAADARIDFAERLRKLREKAGLTQGQLGDKLGVSRGSISYYENTDRVPDIEFLVKVTTYFDVSADYMLGKSENATLLYQDIGLALGLSDKAINRIMENIWYELESKLLHAANTLLKQDTVPSKENLDKVSQLLDLAIRIDSLNLEWEVQNQERRAYNVPKIKDRDVCK